MLLIGYHLRVSGRSKAEDLKQPGHVFPLIPEMEGPSRAGHTEEGDLVDLLAYLRSQLFVKSGTMMEQWHGYLI